MFKSLAFSRPQDGRRCPVGRMRALRCNSISDNNALTLKGRHAFTGQFVGPLVFIVARMALYPVP